jgi:hypothetical protein
MPRVEERTKHLMFVGMGVPRYFAGTLAYPTTISTTHAPVISVSWDWGRQGEVLGLLILTPVLWEAFSLL